VIDRLLQLLETPRSLDDLAGQLGTSPSAVEGVLGLLASRGYVEKACQEPRACGACSVRRLCASPGAEPLEVWKLSAKG
jgi:predicted ArsR family transcriptional regulator